MKIFTTALDTLTGSSLDFPAVTDVVGLIDPDALVGPQGPTGATGADGPQGIQGVAGDTGPAGPGVLHVGYISDSAQHTTTQASPQAYSLPAIPKLNAGAVLEVDFNFEFVQIGTVASMIGLTALQRDAGSGYVGPTRTIAQSTGSSGPARTNNGVVSVKAVFGPSEVDSLGNWNVKLKAMPLTTDFTMKVQNMFATWREFVPT